MKKLLAAAAALAICCSVASCGEKKNDSQTTTSNTKKTIGIAMPSKELERWNNDGESLKSQFEKAGYNIREDTLQNRAYRYLFNNTFLGVKKCNLILRFFKQEELPIYKQN